MRQHWNKQNPVIVFIHNTLNGDETLAFRECWLPEGVLDNPEQYCYEHRGSKPLRVGNVLRNIPGDYLERLIEAIAQQELRREKQVL